MLLQRALHLQAVRRGTTIGAASSVFVCTKPLALQGLVGQHPKPFDRAAPAGRSTSAVSILLTSTKCFPAAYIFVTPRKHTILPPSAKWSATHRQHKAPRPRQRTSEGFSCCLWVFLCRGSIHALTAPAGCYAAQSGFLSTPPRGDYSCRTVGEVHNGDLRHGLFDRLQNVLYLLHRVS